MNFDIHNGVFENGIRTCNRCIMNSSVVGIEFDDDGVCNFCNMYNELETQYPLNHAGEQHLEAVLRKIRQDGREKNYDCIIGVSGGTDSTFTLVRASELGLRPLAVHFDNGWNTEIAVRNIKNATDRLGVDLYTYVVNWNEFRDLQLSFLKASVPEVELPTDLAIRSVLYRAAAREGIKYIIEGTSFRTEGVLPISWGYKDARYLKSIHKMFGKVRLVTFPNLTLGDYFYFNFLKRIQLIRLLNYFPYSKESAKEFLADKVGWVDYGGHHHESVYTRFFQSYLAPQKFKMDRRLVSYSAQIHAGLKTKETALREIALPICPQDIVEKDKAYIAKKLGLSLGELENIIANRVKVFTDYPSYYPLIRRVRPLLNMLATRGWLSGFFQGVMTTKSGNTGKKT